VVAEEMDEMAKLREHYVARSGLVAGEKRSPSAEVEKEKKKKKKKKKEKEKEKRPEKAKSDKEDTEDELGQERGQKRLRSLFSGTCLDPRMEERAKLLRRARKMGKKEGKKRKRSSSEGSSSDSSTSEEDEEVETGEGLFAEKKRALRLTQQYPGCLGAQTIAGMKESLMTSSGTLHSLDRKSLPPLYTQYYRSELHSLVSPSMGQELLTISQTADLPSNNRHEERTGQLRASSNWCQQIRLGYPKEPKELKPLGSNDCTSPSLLRKEELPSFGSGIEAERAQLELNGGERVFSKPLEAGSQCNDRVETHWKPSMPQDGMRVEAEMDTSHASQYDRGVTEQQLDDAGRCEITYDTADNRGPGWRLAFEP
ncbi:unnamed protein product, partial [Durusdinium trenchii]